MTVLVLAPHADDEVLGVGGTMARHAANGRRVVVAVITGHGDGRHPLWPREYWTTVRAECRMAASVLGITEVVFRELPAACLDITPGWQVNRVVDDLVTEYEPDELYVPFAFDLHRDHGAVAYGASVAARPYLQRNRGIKRVAAYETLSETHLAPPYMAPSFQPNLFVDISDTLEIKLEAMRQYSSQLQAEAQPRSITALRALAELRGAHIGCAAAEAFVILGQYEI